MIVFVSILTVATLLVVWVYNTLIARGNEVKNAFATIDAMLKKRFDLIPNLVATVKESARFETSTLENVIKQRGQMAGGAPSLQQLQKMDQESTSALKGLFVQVEAYPDLKSSGNFVQLQNALQDIEDQLAAARRTYNAAVTIYNNALQMFPTSIVAGKMKLKPEELLTITAQERGPVHVGELFKQG